MTDSNPEGSVPPKPTTADHAAIYGLVYDEAQFAKIADRAG